MNNRNKSEYMQDKSERISEFSERSESLAAKIGVCASDLGKKIGISTSMFYLYRSGKHPISKKVWNKLERAEQAAGLGEKKPGDVFRSSEVKEFPPGAENNLPVPQGAYATAKEVHDLREQVARLERMMLRILDEKQAEEERQQ